MKGRRLALAVLAVAGAAGAWALHSGALSKGVPPGAAEQLTASGVIYVEEVRVASAQGGRVAAVLVREGDYVVKGQELWSLDTTLVDAQIAVARAQLETVQAGVRQLEAGIGPATLAVAEEQLEQARVALSAAERGLVDAKLLRDNPQELDMQVAVAEAEVQAATHRLSSAQALKDAAESGKNLEQYTADMIENWSLPVPAPSIPAELQSATWDWWRAWAGLNAASAGLEDAQARLAHWRTVREDPRQLAAQVDTAEAAVQLAEAGVAAAQSRVDAYKAGAPQQQLAAARARVEQAQAALDGLRARRAEMTLRAPTDGIVLSRALHAGELAPAGAALMTLADLSQVTVSVYVAENQLGRMALRGQASVVVDSFPGRTFSGEIVRVADQSQFTPRNVATKEQRVNTVYAVDIRVPNPDGLLKPGMAADVTFLD